MNTPTWFFSERSENDVEQEVTEADQFNSETVDLRETLIRESAQNSQDARAGSEPVRLRIHVAQPEKSYLNSLTDQLAPRLSAAGFNRPDDDVPKAIIIEDFGTKGLTGDINDYNSQDNYRSFFFRHGGSYKSGLQNGRWGLGKLVFSVSSRARCFFGLTRREGEDRSLLLGEAVLRTHRVDGRKFAPHGHFERLESGRILPLTEADFIRMFSQQFGLERTRESGLSVVIPWPSAVPTSEQLMTLVARNYLWPILSGSLIIDAMGTVIDRSTIRDAAKLLPDGLLDFVTEILESDASSLHELPAPELRSGGNYVHADELIMDSERDALRLKFTEGELTGFRIPVPLARKSQKPSPRSAIRIFLKKSPEGVKGDALYVRKDITIPDEARRFGKTDVFAAMIADAGDVAEFLADAENPAHTSWNGQAQRLRTNWAYPGQTLSFVRNAPVRLYQVLNTGIETEVRNALLDFFWIDDPDRRSEPQGKRGSRTKGEPLVRPTGPIPPPPPPAPRKFRIEQKIGGFCIRGDGALSDDELPKLLRLRLGYDVEGGNAVRDWDRYDFDLRTDTTSFTSSAAGVTSEMDGNEILLRIEEPEFEFSLTGFDRNRDLVVEASFTAGG